MASLDTEIDRLYALPLAEFTGARNALARRVPREQAATIKQLQKPTTVAWAVNQLYWHDRSTWKALIATGQALRTAQIAALKGHAAELRDATQAHRAAVADAARRISELAAPTVPSADHVSRMLEAISLSAAPPADPGRFTEVVLPSGFEALAGITPAGRPPDAPAPTPPPGRAARERRTKTAGDEALAAEAANRARAEALGRARAELTRVTASLSEAEGAESAAQAVLDAAREQLRLAEREHARAREATVAARERVRAARAALDALA